MAEQGAPARRSAFHLITLYADDESQPGYAFSGSSTRSAGITREILSSVSGGDETPIRVRMKRPGRRGQNVADENLIELRFSLRSIAPRLFMGSLGKAGWKSPLFFNEYVTNGFDSDAFFRRVNSATGTSLVIFDSLSAFAYAGWGTQMVKPGVAKIYLSHDYEPDFVRIHLLSAVVRKRMRAAMQQTDLLIAASQRDKSQYLTYGLIHEDKVLVYPNIFLPLGADKTRIEGPKSVDAFTIAIIETGWSGTAGAIQDGNELAAALRLLPAATSIRVIAIGAVLARVLSERLPSQVELRRYGRIASRAEFLRVLSDSHVGLNQARWVGGTNVKKYDLAVAGAVVLSNSLGSRGDAIPHEFVFKGERDLASKLQDLSEMDRHELARLGAENRARATAIAEGAATELKRKVSELVRSK